MSVLVCVYCYQSLVCVLVKYFKVIAVTGNHLPVVPQACVTIFNAKFKKCVFFFFFACVQILATNCLTFMRENQLTTYINVK